MKRKLSNNWLLVPVVVTLAMIGISPSTMAICDGTTTFLSGVNDNSGWVPCYVHPLWAQYNPGGLMSQGAIWIWKTQLANPNGETQEYARSFNIEGRPISGLLLISSDDYYDIYLNNAHIGSDNQVDAWKSADSYDISTFLQTGTNILRIEATNEHFDWDELTPLTNPAGIIYKLDVCSNNAPVAIDDAYAMAEDTVLSIPAPGVLTNDNDAEGDTLTASLSTGPSHGTITLSSDGSFTYIPNVNDHGTDSFTYTVSDGKGGTDTATVTITINPINDAPEAIDDLASTLENTPVEINVLTNDKDIDGDTLTVSQVSNPSSGVATLSSDSTIIYTPNSNYNVEDSFTYEVSDSNGETASATVTIKIEPVNDCPVAEGDIYNAVEDTPITIPASGVLENDHDVDSITLTAIIAIQPAKGALVMTPDGSFTYTPDPNYCGEDSFTYTVSDDETSCVSKDGESSTAIVQISIASVNDCPKAVDDAAVVDEDNSVDINVVANDIDVDVDDAISIDSFTQPVNGEVTRKDDGTLTYEPSEDFCGEDSFTYKATDGYCESNEATVSITVNSINDAPVAEYDEFTATEDIVLEIPAKGVLANDVDIDGDTLSVSSSAQPSNGVVTLKPDGSFTYTSNPNYNGEDSFTYEVSDNNGGTASATVAITIDPVNDVPVAADDGATLDEDSSVTIQVLANDMDIDGDELTVTVTSGPTNGDSIENEDGTISYTPEPDYNGQDSFKYTISDVESESNEATVAITIDPLNDAPTADDDDFAMIEDSVLSIGVANGVLANDEDVDGDTLTASLSVAPINGVAVVNPDGSFTYSPSANYNGEDSFTYEVSDNNGGTALATVIITIDPISDIPVAVDDSGATDENTALEGIDVIANDYDLDEEVLTVASVTDPAQGTATVEDGAITYTPNLWYSGEDSFSYTIADSTGLTATATVTITIEDVIPSTEDICAFIQALPDDAFDKDASNQKKTFCNKLAAVGKQIANNDYRGAIEKLENDIRSKADGSLEGNPKNDWITDPDAQAELCSMIDTLLDALKTL